MAAAQNRELASSVAEAESRVEEATNAAKEER